MRWSIATSASSGAPAGRGVYAEAVDVNRRVEAARRKVAALLGLADPSHLIFTLNGTDSLNTVIHGLLRPGDHVVSSVVEHNSVLRPLELLERRGQISVTRVDSDDAGIVDPDAFRAAIRPRTRLVALAHASNVTGAIQPIEEVARIARSVGVRVLCDAAQTAGHLPLDMERLNVDFLATPGHKGLLGPLGTGVLAIRPGCAGELESLRQGGTGTESHDIRQPDALPSKFEAGNLNVPGILGLAAGVDYLADRGPDATCRHGQELIERLLDGLAGIQRVRVLGPPTAVARVPLVSVVVEGYDPQEVALGLDAAYRIQVRSGLHCAP